MKIELEHLSTNDLNKLYLKIGAEIYERGEREHQKKMMEKGVLGLTTKDIKASIWFEDEYDYDNNPEYRWQFYTKDGKDLYYELKESKYYKPDPEDPEGDEIYNIFELIPNGFSECSENWFESGHTFEEAKELLESLGMEVTDERPNEQKGE